MNTDTKITNVKAFALGAKAVAFVRGRLDWPKTALKPIVRTVLDAAKNFVAGVKAGNDLYSKMQAGPRPDHVEFHDVVAGSKIVGNELVEVVHTMDQHGNIFFVSVRTSRVVADHK